MRIKVIPGNELTDDQIALWSSLQRSNPLLDSAFFCPEFTRIVATVRSDVEVALLEEDGRTVGFFPFQRNRNHTGQAVVGRLSEFHGLIAHPQTEWDAGELIQHCRLLAWHFDHLVAWPPSLLPYRWSFAESPYLDLSRGFPAYCEALRQSGSKLVEQTLHRLRKLEQAVGPVRFEMHSTDASAFNSLIEWKGAQHRRTKVLEIFRFPWVVEMLDRLRLTQTAGFAGVMSTLWADDRLVAIHLGMRSHNALHLWFPTFDRTFEKYSPGIILLLKLAESSPSRGIKRIDLGRGQEPYKHRFMSGVTPVAIGAVDNRRARRLLRKGWHDAKRWIRSSPHRAQLELPLRVTRRLRQWLAFH